MFEQREEKTLEPTPMVKTFGLEEERKAEDGFGLDGGLSYAQGATGLQHETELDNQAEANNFENIFDNKKDEPSIKVSTIKTAPVLDDVPKEDYHLSADIDSDFDTQDTSANTMEKAEEEPVKMSNKEAREAKLNLQILPILQSQFSIRNLVFHCLNQSEIQQILPRLMLN